MGCSIFGKTLNLLSKYLSFMIKYTFQLIQLYRRSQKTVLEMEMMSKKNETEM